MAIVPGPVDVLDDEDEDDDDEEDEEDEDEEDEEEDDEEDTDPPPPELKPPPPDPPPHAARMTQLTDTNSAIRMFVPFGQFLRWAQGPTFPVSPFERRLFCPKRGTGGRSGLQI